MVRFCYFFGRFSPWEFGRPAVSCRAPPRAPGGSRPSDLQATRARARCMDYSTRASRVRFGSYLEQAMRPRHLA